MHFRCKRHFSTPQSPHFKKIGAVTKTLTMETVYEELCRENEQKRKDERLLASLLEEATALHAQVYSKEVAKGKKKYKAMTGFMLQSLFGRTQKDGRPIWLLKDLDAGQLHQLIVLMSKKRKKLSFCCGAEVETREVKVPNRQHQFDPSAPELKMARRRFCTACGHRNTAITVPS